MCFEIWKEWSNSMNWYTYIIFASLSSTFQFQLLAFSNGYLQMVYMYKKLQRIDHVLELTSFCLRKIDSTENCTPGWRIVLFLESSIVVFFKLCVDCMIWTNLSRFICCEISIKTIISSTAKYKKWNQTTLYQNKWNKEHWETKTLRTNSQ